MRHRPFVPVVLLTSGLAACDGVRDSDYEGEVLASLEGTVTFEETPDLDEDTGVAVIWELATRVAGRRFVEFAEVTGEFPARFRLDFYQPPDDEVQVEFPDGNAVTLGRLHVTSTDLYPYFRESGFSYGYEACNPQTAIAFIRDDVVPGSAAAAYFGCGLDAPGSPPCSALTAGYHVMDIEFGQRWDGESECLDGAPPEDPDYCEPDDVRLAADDLETEIEIDLEVGCAPLYYRYPPTGW